MERLTEKHYGTNGYFMKCSEDCANDDEMCGGCPYLDKIIDRLGAYEDTGLTPEEIVVMKAELASVKENLAIALEFIKDQFDCVQCMHEEKNYDEEPCASCKGSCDKWEWKGVRPW